MTKEKLYIKPTEEEYEDVKNLNKTNKKILTYSILAIIMILVTIMHFTTIVNIISSTIKGYSLLLLVSILLNKL